MPQVVETIHLAAVLSPEVKCASLNDVHHPLEVLLQSDGDLHEGRVEAQLVVDLLDDSHGLRAQAVQFVDEGDARDFVAPHLSVHCRKRRVARVAKWAEGLDTTLNYGPR